MLHMGGQVTLLLYEGAVGEALYVTKRDVYLIAIEMKIH